MSQVDEPNAMYRPTSGIDRGTMIRDSSERGLYASRRAYDAQLTGLRLETKTVYITYPCRIYTCHSGLQM